VCLARLGNRDETRDDNRAAPREKVRLPRVFSHGALKASAGPDFDTYAAADAFRTSVADSARIVGNTPGRGTASGRP